MNIEHLRHSLKVKWLLYYRQNRPWLVRLKIWETYDGQRRPSSSFILATVSILEPQLTQIFPFIIDLSSNPDQIVVALGLNFDPDEELKSMTKPLSVGEINAIKNGLKETIPATETNDIGNGLTKAIPVNETNDIGNGLTATIPITETSANGSLLTATIPATETNANGNGLIATIPATETNANENGLFMQKSLSLADEVSLSPSTHASNLPSWVDEACSGKGSPNAGLVLSILVAIGSLVVVFIGFTS